jgi:HK97 gp10 family phage protein
MARKAKLFKKQSVTMEFDSDIEAQLTAYADKVKGTFKEAAFKAATVLYDEMHIRVPAPVGGTGNLKASLYRYRLKDTSDSESTFAVGVNVRKAPHWHFLELGTRKQAARPFIRPTYDAKISEAGQAAIRSIKERLA